MNWDRIEGQWKEFAGHAKTKWGKLTDDDVKVIAGKRESLVGKIQERYGILKDEAERGIDEWLAKLSPSKDDKVRPPTQSSIDQDRATNEGMTPSSHR